MSTANNRLRKGSEVLSEIVERGKQEAAQREEVAPAVKTVVIEIPVAPLRHGVYLPQNVQLGIRSQQSQEAMFRIREGLSAQHTQLSSGRHVDQSAQVFEWILEQVAAQIAEK